MQSFLFFVVFFVLFTAPMAATAQWDAEARLASRSVYIVDGSVEANRVSAADRLWLARVAEALPVGGSLEAEFGEVRVCIGPDAEAACILLDWRGALPELLQIVRRVVEGEGEA